MVFLANDALLITDDLQVFAIPNGAYVSQDASTSSPVIYEDPEDVLNESGINQEDYMQPFSVTIPYVSQDARASSAISLAVYEDPETVANESGINQEDYMQPFSVTIPNEAYVSQDARASSAISLAVYEDPETVANESGINLAEYLPPFSSNEAYISHDASSVIEETSGTNLSG